MNTNKSRSSYSIVPVSNRKWPKAQVLAEARRVTKHMLTDNSSALQTKLDDMLRRAGWNEDEFIDALCQDVIKAGSKKERG